MNYTDTIKGIILALVAAYIYPIVLMSLNNPWSNPVGSFVVVPLVGLFLSFWFVIPLGTLIGNLIPGIVTRRSLRDSIVFGLLLGLLVGFIASVALLFQTLLATGELKTRPSILFESEHDYIRNFIFHFLTISIYSAVWIGGYICLTGRKFAKNNEEFQM